MSEPASDLLATLRGQFDKMKIDLWAGKTEVVEARIDSLDMMVAYFQWQIEEDAIGCEIDAGYGPHRRKTWEPA